MARKLATSRDKAASVKRPLKAKPAKKSPTSSSKNRYASAMKRSMIATNLKPLQIRKSLLASSRDKAASVKRPLKAKTAKKSPTSSSRDKLLQL